MTEALNESQPIFIFSCWKRHARSFQCTTIKKHSLKWLVATHTSHVTHINTTSHGCPSQQNQSNTPVAFSRCGKSFETIKVIISARSVNECSLAQVKMCKPVTHTLCKCSCTNFSKFALVQMQTLLAGQRSKEGVHPCIYYLLQYGTYTTCLHYCALYFIKQSKHSGEAVWWVGWQLPVSF